jgi:hypothetical protein
MEMDLTAVQQLLVVSIIIPVVIGFFKREITNFFDDLSTYRNRRFDEDGDPGEGCECYIQKGTTGLFKRILVKEYTFHLFASKREVITVQDAPDKADGVIIVPYTYAQWRDRLRGSLVKDREEVERLIERNLKRSIKRLPTPEDY